MKKQIRLTILSIIFILILVAYRFVQYVPTRTDRQIEYYSAKENYVTVIGRVYHIAYGADMSYLYLAFEDKTVEFQDETFVIEGENLVIIQQNGFDEKVSLGDEIEFVSATEIFWDGYSMPIVALSVNGEVLLEFEDGYRNLLDLICD